MSTSCCNLAKVIALAATDGGSSPDPRDSDRRVVPPRNTWHSIKCLGQGFRYGDDETTWRAEESANGGKEMEVEDSLGFLRAPNSQRIKYTCCWIA